LLYQVSHAFDWSSIGFHIPTYSPRILMLSYFSENPPSSKLGRNVWAEFQHKENRPLSTVAFPLLSGWSTWPPRCTKKKHVTSHILKFRWNLKIMQLKRKILFHPPPFLGSKYEFFPGCKFCWRFRWVEYVLSRYIFMLLLDVLLLPQMISKKIPWLHPPQSIPVTRIFVFLGGNRKLLLLYWVGR